MKPTIAFYISSHGFGHMTRCLAIIEEIIENTDYKVYIACGKEQNEFARMYLPKHNETNRILVKDLITDIGLINKNNSLRVDESRLENSLRLFVKEWEQKIRGESEFLKHESVSLVVSDISPLAPLVADIIGAKCVAVSNFTWVEQYENLNISKEIVNKFRVAYEKLDAFIEYDLATKTGYENLTRAKVGFISRKTDPSRVAEIKNEYSSSVFITCGKATNLENVHIKNYSGNIFTTSGMDISYDGNVAKLPTCTLDTQNYITASDMVIAKAGWGTIAEVLIASKKLVLIERPEVYEDTYMINLLRNRNLAISIPENYLRSLDIKDLMHRANQDINKASLDRINNDIGNVFKLLSL